MITSSVKTESAVPPSFLTLADGTRLAYRLTPGELPGVLFFSGFRSDMNGTKAMALETFCREEGRRFVCFDYTGHGQSSGDFMLGTIGAWKNDALSILDHVATGPNILAGSSMGAWIMVLAALERYEQVMGMLGIANAPDFTENLIWQPASPAQKKELKEKGVIYLPDCYGEAPYPITRALIEEGRKHLLLNREIRLGVPVRLIHGENDQEVPWQTSKKFMGCLKSSDIALELVPDGDHRLSWPGHIAFLCRMLEELCYRSTSQMAGEAR